MISEAINRPVEYKEADMDGYTKMLRDFQVPEDIIRIMQYLFREVLDGRNESITHDIEKVTGRKPTTFAEYVIKASRTRVWNV